MAVADRVSTDQETLTIVYQAGDDGWVTAQIAEVPPALSQGRTRAEAKANVIAALHDLTREPSPVERLLYRARALLASR